MKGADLFLLYQGSFGVASRTSCTLCVDLYKCIQFGVQFVDLRQVSVNKFDRRDFLRPDLLGHRNGRQESQIAHKPLPIYPRMARSSIFFSWVVSGRCSPFASSPNCRGPIATRTKRNTSTPRVSTMRRIWRFLPSSITIPTQPFLRPARKGRTCFARKTCPSFVFTPRSKA